MILPEEKPQKKHYGILNDLVNDRPINDVFLDDDLHMNAKGYAIWKKTISSFLD